MQRRPSFDKPKLLIDAAEKIAAVLGVCTAWLVHGTLPIARGTQIDPPVPAGGTLILNFLELPPVLASAVKRLSMQNGSTVEIALLHLAHQGLEAIPQKNLGLRRGRKQEREIARSLPC